MSTSLRLPRVVAYQLAPLDWMHVHPAFDDPRAAAAALGSEVYRTPATLGIAAKVTSEGLFCFDFSGSSPLLVPPAEYPLDFTTANEVMAWRVRVLNAHLACFYTVLMTHQGGMHAKMIVTPSDLILLPSLDEYHPVFQSASTAALATVLQPTIYLRHPELYQLAVFSRGHNIRLGTIDASFQLLAATLRQHATDAVLSADLLLRSCKAIEDDNDEFSLILAWAVSETLVARFYQRQVDAHMKAGTPTATAHKMVKELADRAKKGQTPDAKTMVAHLLADEAISQSLADDLLTVINQRDGWLHRLEAVSAEHAGKALMLAQALLKVVDSVSFQIVPFHSRTYEVA